MRVYHYLASNHALDNIKNRRLKLSKMENMNDPYETKAVRFLDPALQAEAETFIRQRFEKYGVACFSRCWNNILMWSHYAEKHKGICLGFDVSDKSIYRVKYPSEIRVIEGRTTVKETRKVLRLMAAAKWPGWRYEKEVRVFDHRQESGFMNFDDDLQLKEVIAGASCSTSKAEIEAAVRDYPEEVEIKKARIALDRFEIVVDERGFEPAPTDAPCEG